MAGIIIFYFSSSTGMKKLLKVDPLSKEMIAERRKFVLEFVSAAMFKDKVRDHTAARLQGRRRFE
jgi:hypothetical protein